MARRGLGAESEGREELRGVQR
ncbi:hypothetical protein PENFLA_c059G05929 [Penicillium flavigenum]|uniref:Uncharacterized protein n=1 Tax=Penicillium flavigenum TaxID=254877 RepID=A0A1V6SGM8_9EURO|nr:hypothetical protein PENFLA_c059G05929 [Penicillium flavigenum]